MTEQLSKILKNVQKPARYSGGEFNSVVKDKAKVDTRIAFCFPDTYEIGMSHLGLRILYGLLNEREGVWCERAFAPWTDMETQLRQNNMPLYALESGDGLAGFDMLMFSLQYELSYTTMLNMLDLAGLEVLANERGENDPLVIAGGPCTYNPEPLCDFVDIFVIGDGEDLVLELVDLHRSCATKAEFVKKAAKLKGVYAPNLYNISYNPDGTIEKIESENGALPVEKYVVDDLDKAYYPTKWMVPSTEVVHDRCVLEIFRGCWRGCRFCQAGYAYRPVRYKSVDTLVGQAVDCLKATGYEEISLASLSTSDYPHLNELCDKLLDWCGENSVSMSLPSLRADKFDIELAKKIQTVRKSGLTFAPEAGSQRMRDIINKNITEQDLLNSCGIAFESGYNTIKLYFMLGLPGETDEDVAGIAKMAHNVVGEYKRRASNKSRGLKVTVSTSFFVPKPHTAFQWVSQDASEEYERKCRLLKSSITAKAVTYNWHHSQASVIEAVLARGDRRVAKAVYNAFKNGCRLEGWDECFDYEKWRAAFEKAGLDMDFYARRKREIDEVLPWEHVTLSVGKEFLEKEYCKAMELVETKAEVE